MKRGVAPHDYRAFELMSNERTSTYTRKTGTEKIKNAQLLSDWRGKAGIARLTDGAIQHKPRHSRETPHFQ